MLESDTIGDSFSFVIAWQLSQKCPPEILLPSLEKSEIMHWGGVGFFFFLASKMGLLKRLCTTTSSTVKTEKMHVTGLVAVVYTRHQGLPPEV